MTVEISTLPSGIKIITEKIPSVRSVSIGIWIRIGSRYETKSINGISHFIEHMLFKGTKNRSAKEIAISIDSIGGHLDAFTSREYTCFFATALDEYMPAIVEILSDITLNPTFDKLELEKERMVIMEEIRMSIDTPEEVIHDIFLNKALNGNPLGMPILGTINSINNITQKDIREFYEKRYTPSNIIITAAGNLEHNKIHREFEKYFSQKFGNEDPNDTTIPHKPSFNSGFLSVERELEQIYICMGTMGIKITDTRRYASHILNIIFGNGMSSRLFQKIREEKGLAYAIYSYNMTFTDCGIFAIYANTGQDQTYELISTAINEIENLTKNGITKDELSRAKTQLKGNLMLNMESTSARMTKLAKEHLYFEHSFDLDQILNMIDSVSIDMVNGLIHDIFNKNGLYTVVLGKFHCGKDNIHNVLNTYHNNIKPSKIA